MTQQTIQYKTNLGGGTQSGIFALGSMPDLSGLACQRTKEAFAKLSLALSESLPVIAIQEANDSFGFRADMKYRELPATHFPHSLLLWF